MNRKRTLFSAAVITAASILLSACENTGNAASETVSSSDVSTEDIVSESTEASSAGATEESEQTDAQLMTYLQYIENNFCEDAYAGISLRSAGCAVDMMNWYIDEKPGDIVITDTAKEYILSLPESDRSAFSQGVTMVYESAQQIAGENGAELAADAGYTGEISWTGSDADDLFQAIFKGFDEA